MRQHLLNRWIFCQHFRYKIIPSLWVLCASTQVGVRKNRFLASQVVKSNQKKSTPPGYFWKPQGYFLKKYRGLGYFVPVGYFFSVPIVTSWLVDKLYNKYEYFYLHPKTHWYNNNKVRNTKLHVPATNYRPTQQTKYAV